MDNLQLAKFGVKLTKGQTNGTASFCATVHAETGSRTWALAGQVNVAAYRCRTSSIAVAPDWDISASFSLGDRIGTTTCIQGLSGSVNWDSCYYLVVSIEFSNVSGLASFGDVVYLNYGVDTIILSPTP